MQTIQNHVVSLDLAKKLVDKGVKIESEFYWPPAGDVVLSSYDFGDGVLERKDCIPAPLASELGEVLPVSIKWKEFGNIPLKIQRPASSAWIVEYRKVCKTSLEGVWDDSTTLPDAMAKILIYLKEKELI